MSHTYYTFRFVDPSQPVWIEQVDGSGDNDDPARVEMQAKIGSGSCVIVLMGPTGSGKSSFIEAIASNSGRDPLGIAKDQLESVTQKPQFYVVKNLKFVTSLRGQRIVYLLDTPGLADPTISEMQILNQLTYWRDKCLDDGYVRILYFHPITDIRVPKSRKRCLDMIKGFWGPKCIPITMLVTSMWDCINEGSEKVAGERFSQMSENHWADLTEGGSKVLKFENTFESAMYILDTVLGNTKDQWHPMVTRNLTAHDTGSDSMYEALSDRIASLEQQHITLTEDIQRPEVYNNAELFTLLTNDLTKTERLLKEFTTQMKDYLIHTGACQDEPADIEDRNSAAELASRSTKLWRLPKQLIKWVVRTKVP